MGPAIRPESTLFRGFDEWYRPVSRDEKRKGHIAIPAPASLPWELKPPKEWIGWQRQRLRPLLPALLLPSAWVLGLLSISLVLLLLNDGGEFPPFSAALVAVSSPLLFGSYLVLLTAIQNSGSPMVVISSLLGRTRGLVLLVSISGVIVGLVDAHPADHWVWWVVFISSSLVVLEWMVLGSVGLALPSSRWVMPFEGDIDVDRLKEDGWRWRTDSPRWSRTLLATKDLGRLGRLELSGMTLAEHTLISLQWRHPTGQLVDPWHLATLEDDLFWPRLRKLFAVPIGIDEIQSALLKPPMKVDGKGWDSFFQFCDEEE